MALVRTAVKARPLLAARLANFHAMVVQSAKTAKAASAPRTAEMRQFEKVEDLPRQDPLANVVSWPSQAEEDPTLIFDALRT